MKILKRVLLGLISLFLVLALLLAGSLAWVFTHPKETWQYVEKHYMPADLHITWDDMSFSAHRLSGWDFHIFWQIQNLQIVKQTPLLNVPVDQVWLEASIFPFSETKLHLQQLKVIAQKPLQVTLQKSEKVEPAKNFFQQAQGIFDKLETYHKMLKVDSIEARVLDLKFATEPGKEPLQISAQVVQEVSTDLLHFSAKVLLPAENPLSIAASGDLQMLKMSTPEAFLKAEVEFSGAGTTTKQILSLTQQDKKTSLVSEGRVDYANKKVHLIVTPRLSVSLTPKLATTTLRADFTGIPGPLVKINRFEAELKTPLEENIVWSESPSQFTAKAPVDLFFIDAKMRAPLEKSCECKIPETLKVSADGKVWLAHLFAAPKEQKPLLDVRILADTVDNKLITVNFAGGVKIDRTPEKYLFFPSLDGTASINSFQGLRRFLEAKNILIPAPLNVLEGKINFKAQGPVDTSDKDHKFPLVLETDLSSPRQSVKIRTESTVKVTLDFKEIFVDVLAKISDLQLELPPLDPLKGAPRLTLDKRILRTPPVKEKPSSVKFYLSLGVETTKPGAIRLLSNLFNPYLPVSLKIQRSENKENSGFIQTEPFEIEYLRRKVQVARLKLDLNHLEEDVIPVDAQFEVKQTNYTVFINVAGPITKPHITMTSTPYLPESEIISVLLYDRTNDELIAADAETAGGVQAAIADRAIGLFGLWAFASTPIKSFSYNPVTKIYTATLTLTDDLTAGIGTNWEETTRLELRKRVSKRWMLTAAWTPATQDEDPSTKLVLQWEKRF